VPPDPVPAEPVPTPDAHHLHLDPVGGVAGDMVVASLWDLAPGFDPAPLLAALGTPRGLDVARVDATDQGFAGSRLGIEGEVPPPPRAAVELLALVAAAALPQAVGERALDMLRRLAEAEAAVHGMALEAVHFHELASWDTLVDLTLTAGLLEHLGVRTASIGALPLGGGTVPSAHGALPVPAPATVRLLRGFHFEDDGIGGERVTPTGAAILAHLAPLPALPGAMALIATGCGFGTRRLPGRANQLRALLFAPADATASADRVALLRFEVDDQTGEDLAIGLDRIRAVVGVRDVVAWPAFGKKGRLVTAVQVLADPTARDAAIEACFVETTTIGLRHQEVDRAVLPRRAQAEEGRPVKVVRRPDGRSTTKLEADALAETGGAAARATLRRRLEAGADSGLGVEVDVGGDR